MKRIAVVAVGLLLALSGCSAGANAASTPTPSPTPTPTYATENQVASVVAQYESDWRETMDGAGGCRAQWTFSPGSIEGMTCYLKEQTLVTTAEIVVRDLGELDVSPSVTALVDDTTRILQSIVHENLKTVCGDAPGDPADTPECTTALGGLYFQYSALETQLDAWKPYL